MRELQGFELCFVSGGGPFCGPQDTWAANFVPDKVFGRDFGSACKDHDRRYSEALMPRAEADAIFLDDMLTQASGNALATATAYVYYAFVSVFGGLFYGTANAGKTPDASQANDIALDLASAACDALPDELDDWVEVNGIENMFMERVVENAGLPSGGGGDEDFIPPDAYAGRWAPA